MSEPDRGANAIIGASRLVAFLDDYQQELRANADPDCPSTRPTRPLTSVSSTAARRPISSLANAASPGASAFAHRRPDAIEARVRAHAAEHIDPWMKIARGGRRDYPPQRGAAVDSDTDSSAEQIIRHLTGLNQSGVVAYGTEAGHFQQAGIPGVIFGPGTIKQAHQPDEFIAISQIDQCRRFMDLIAWAERG